MLYHAPKVSNTSCLKCLQHKLDHAQVINVRTGSALIFFASFLICSICTTTQKKKGKNHCEQAKNASVRLILSKRFSALKDTFIKGLSLLTILSKAEITE